MADTMDMRIPLGQGNAIKEVHKAKQQDLDLKRRAAARRRKQKEKGKKEPPEKFTNSKASQDQHRDSKQMGGEDKDSKARGSLLDVVI